ncbi:hypothetical protein FLONG3_5886 [Fusarium longipes]|uniref:Uncharacterized protein n=1 Tax=Fusarium longipes TaxID=694270 RepID=A0A395SRB9_9HYPO|nr:hypothetical protein FLONG3_5886 [Fusarium longipes]
MQDVEGDSSFYHDGMYVQVVEHPQVNATPGGPFHRRLILDHLQAPRTVRTRDLKPLAELRQVIQQLKTELNTRLITPKNEHWPVSPRQMSEMDVLAPPRKVSSSSHGEGFEMTETQTCRTPSRVPDTDVFAGTSTIMNHTDLNHELVEAISRNIVHQIHLLSLKDEPSQTKHKQKNTTPPASGSPENESRTPSQREALDLFTHELQQYVEQTGAKGKLPVMTPTAPRSSASLQTIAALLPFRSEFKAAGLAVTSKDQANQIFCPSSLKHRATTTSLSKQPHLVQVDSATRCPSSSTEIPFPAAEDMDEWRYAMVDNDERSRKRTKAENQAPRKHCDSCQSKPRPLYSEAPEEKSLTGPTSKIPKSHMQSFPERPDMVPLKKKESCQRKDRQKQAAKPSSRHFQGKKRQGQTAAAFFSGPKTPAGLSSVSKRSTVPYGADESLENHRSRAGNGIRTHVSRSTKFGQDQIPGAGSLRLSKILSQPVLAYNDPRRCHSLSADVVVPQHSQSIKRYDKPLPEPPQPESSSTTSVGEDCRLSAGADTSRSTPEKGCHDKGKGKALHEKDNNCQTSSISPNHITVCSRGFSGHRIGRPNVPKRMSSIQTLRRKTREYDQVSILDRDVLRGLHIAASAACNEQIDAFIREETGLHIRQFLSDLTPLEALGNIPPRDIKERRAKRRKAEIREVKRRTWSCVPNVDKIPLLAPAYDEHVCPHWAERWELRSRPLGCQVSSITSLTAIVTIVSTLAFVLLVVLLAVTARWVQRYGRKNPGWLRLWNHRWGRAWAQHGEREPLLSQDRPDNQGL